MVDVLGIYARFGETPRMFDSPRSCGWRRALVEEYGLLEEQ